MTCIGARAQLSSARYGVAIGYGARGGVGYESAFAGGEIASNRSIIHASIPQSYATTTNATSKFMLQSTGAGTVTSGLESNSMATFKGRVLSRQTAGSAGTVGDWRVWDIEFIVENVAGTHAILGTPVITLVDGAAGAAWTVDSIDAIAGGYRINITGEVDKTIKWHSCVYGQRLYFA
jgi:hypothetical protein